MGERVVDLRHREGLDDGLDPVAGGEVEHGGDRRGRADGAAGDVPLGHDEGEGLDGDGLEDGADDVEAAFGSERVDVGVPVQRDVDGGDDVVE